MNDNVDYGKICKIYGSDLTVRPEYRDKLNPTPTEFGFGEISPEIPINENDMCLGTRRVKQYIAEKHGEVAAANIDWTKKPEDLPANISQDWDIRNTFWKRCNDEGIRP